MGTRGSIDLDLGTDIHQELFRLGLEDGPYLRDPDQDDAKTELSIGVRKSFEWLGLDLTDDSLCDTPDRFARMVVDELCWGLYYENFPKCTTVLNKMGYDQMVLVRDIQTTSLCEHHLQTIDGFTHIAYIPDKKVMGLSKFARVVEFFARRPQIQERLTEQVFAALAFILGTQDIGVVINATHFCMKARGVGQQQATTQTDKMGGRFLENPSLRSEFLNAIR